MVMDAENILTSASSASDLYATVFTNTTTKFARRRQ